MLINITASPDFSMEEYDEITSLIRNVTDPEEANIITGVVFDENSRDEVKVTVVATGFGVATGRPISEARPLAEPAAAPAAAPRPLAGTADGLTKMGKDDWDIPSFLRKR